MNNSSIELTLVWLLAALFCATLAIVVGRDANRDSTPGQVGAAFVSGFLLSAACTFAVLLVLSL
jgi:hypothetical protein